MSTRFGPDEGGQMVLLGALLVLITYFGIIAVTSRIDAVASRTASQLAPDFADEVRGVQAQLATLSCDDDLATAGEQCAATWEGALFLPVYAGGRGFALRFLQPDGGTGPQPECVGPDLVARFTLSDARSEATILYTRTGAC